MPPKRRGTTTAKAAPAAKKSRTSTNAEPAASAGAKTAETPESTAAQEPPAAAKTKAKSAPKKKAAPSRWTVPSCSANIADQYKTFLQGDKKDPFAFALICEAPFSNGDSDNEEEDEDESEEEEEETSSRSKNNNNKKKNKDDGGDKPKCDGGKKCYCTKFYEDHPEHPYVMTRAAKCMFVDLRAHCQIRDPDNFGMYTFNDHSAYGALEVLQNVILDFEEANGWQEKWAVCEALGCFLKTDTYGTLASQIDDGEGADAIWHLMGRLFLSMLAQFERDGLLTNDGPVKNLGFIMAVWMSIPSDMRGYSLLEESTISEPLGPVKRGVKKWWPHSFDKQILAYARKYDITLKGLQDLEDLIEDIEDDGEGDLPDPEHNTEKADIFHYQRELKRYKEKYGGTSTHARKGQKTPKSAIGGDNLDITAWTSAERKAAAYNKKDPLTKKDLDMIKEGCVMSRG